MFDIGWSEMAVIAVVALIVIGPRDLPKLLYTAGKLAAKARATLHEFQQGLADMAREAELDEVRQKIEKARSFNPVSELDRALDPTGDVRRSLDPTAPPPARPVEPHPALDGTPPASAAVDVAAPERSGPEPFLAEPSLAEPVPRSPGPAAVPAAVPVETASPAAPSERSRDAS